MIFIFTIIILLSCIEQHASTFNKYVLNRMSYVSFVSVFTGFVLIVKQLSHCSDASQSVRVVSRCKIRVSHSRAEIS